MSGLLERRIVERTISQTISDIEFALIAARSVRDEAVPGSGTKANYRSATVHLEAAAEALAKAAQRLAIAV